MSPSHRSVRSALPSSFVLSIVLVTSLTLLPRIGGAQTATGVAMTKLGPELQSLYEAYRVALTTGTPLVSTNPLVRVDKGGVVIDAVASGDVEDLKKDLVALGLEHAASAGRIVSGQLPVSAIPAMAALPSLRYARAAMSATKGGGGPGR